MSGLGMPYYIGRKHERKAVQKQLLALLEESNDIAAVVDFAKAMA